MRRSLTAGDRALALFALPVAIQLLLAATAQTEEAGARALASAALMTFIAHKVAGQVESRAKKRAKTKTRRRS